MRFNTASGKYCCNYIYMAYRPKFAPVSIPQAVSTVATWERNMPQLLLKQSFNTASGKYCYFITFVFPSFQSGTRDVRASSSLCSSAASHPSSHTVNGKYYSIITFVFPSLQARTRDVRTPSSLCASVPRTLRRIPQAVSTVATCLKNSYGKRV